MAHDLANHDIKDQTPANYPDLIEIASATVVSLFF